MYSVSLKQIMSQTIATVNIWTVTARLTTMSKRKLIVFGWGGVIEPCTYQTTWKKIERICGIKGIDLRELYFSHPEMELINNRFDFLERLEDILSDVQMKELTVGDDALICEAPDFGKARFVYDVYQSVFSSVPYRKDVAGLIYSLSENGINTAIFSDVGVWDLKRQEKQIDTSLCSFVWQSCRTGFSKRGDTAYLKAANEVFNAGFDDKDVLFIDNNQTNLDKSEDICGWLTHLDKDNEPAEKLSGVISAFLSE